MNTEKLTTHFLNRVINRAKPLVVKLTGLGPFGLQKVVLEKVLNQVFDEALEDDELAFLEGRFLTIAITDLKLQWRITYQAGALRALPPGAEADASISGEVREFVLLASRREDPDTLFFQRRLSIEGDTELGLEVKNLMDSVDLSSLPTLVQRALNHAGNLASAAA